MRGKGRAWHEMIASYRGRTGHDRRDRGSLQQRGVGLVVAPGDSPGHSPGHSPGQENSDDDPVMNQ